MYPAYQMSDCSDDNLKFAVQTSVNHIVMVAHKPFMPEGQGYWATDRLAAFGQRVESHSIKVEVMALPMSSSFVDRAENPSIMLGNADRDGDIDNMSSCIQAAGEAGIPCLKYNLTLLGVVSTGRRCGRGGSSYRYFNFEEMKEQNKELTQAGRVNEGALAKRCMPNSNLISVLGGKCTCRYLPSTNTV